MKEVKMASLYIKSGNSFRVVNSEALNLQDAIPGGNYMIKEMPMTGELFLESIEAFSIPSKVYGDSLKMTDRIITTFLSRTGTTGVMLTGEKGSGKTLLSKNVCTKLAVDHNIPTIVINTALSGDRFNSFIQSITQPCVILFDEFEKVYDRDDQEAILTLLDGVFPTNKLFLLTCNDKYRVDTHMRNRPGRIFYMIDFTGLDAAFVREYCEDNLNNKSYIDTVCTISGVFSAFNFDMLQALVQEMNRYDEGPQAALQYLNVRAEFDGSQDYTLTVRNAAGVAVNTREIEGNPLARPIEVGFDPDENDPDCDYVYVSIGASNMVEFNASAGRMVFRDKGHDFELVRKKDPAPYRFYDAF